MHEKSYWATGHARDAAPCPLAAGVVSGFWGGGFVPIGLEGLGAGRRQLRLRATGKGRDGAARMGGQTVGGQRERQGDEDGQISMRRRWMKTARAFCEGVSPEMEAQSPIAHSPGVRPAARNILHNTYL